MFVSNLTKSSYKQNIWNILTKFENNFWNLVTFLIEYLSMWEHCNSLTAPPNNQNLRIHNLSIDDFTHVEVENYLSNNMIIDIITFCPQTIIEWSITNWQGFVSLTKCNDLSILKHLLHSDKLGIYQFHCNSAVFVPFCYSSSYLS